MSDVATVANPIGSWTANESLKRSKLMHEYCARLTANRDMHVIITAASETGVGKTTLAVVLAMLWDQHGWSPDKATLSPREYATMYDDVPPGSVLLLDEVEQAADARRSTSRENVNLAENFAAKRYRQVFGIMTAPTKTWVDKRMSADSADYWILCHETPSGKPKGEATVYRMKHNPHYETDYQKREETITWPNIETHPYKRRMDRIKAGRMEGTSSEEYVHRSEYEDLKRNYWNKCMKMTRFHFVQALSEWGLSQNDIADLTDLVEESSDGDVESLSQTRISDLCQAEAFEEVYSE